MLLLSGITQILNDIHSSPFTFDAIRHDPLSFFSPFFSRCTHTKTYGTVSIDANEFAHTNIHINILTQIHTHIHHITSHLLDNIICPSGFLLSIPHNPQLINDILKIHPIKWRLGTNIVAGQQSQYVYIQCV